jgi:hypothetical protein
VTRVRLGRIFWIGAAAILVAAALVALVSVLRGDFSDTDGRILGTLAAALLAGSTVVGGLALVERGVRTLGWTAVVVSAPAFAAIAYSIWSFAFDGDGDAWRWGWAGALALVAALIAVTARLIARAPAIMRLAGVAAVLATIAAAFSYVAVWNDDPGDAIGRVIAVLWILAGLAYLLVPVLQRFSTVGRAADAVRVLAVLDGVELVATRSRVGTLDPGLEPGERLLLRRGTEGNPTL